jgi:hypothetical protein
MVKINISMSVIIALTLISVTVSAQNKSKGINSITSSELESYASFLGSPLLQGRKNGEEGLEIASNFIVSQAKLIGLKPANGSSFIQFYTVIKKSIDEKRTKIQVISDGKDSSTIKEPFYQLIPFVASDFIMEGEVVFAGYGIKSVKYNYNDFDSLQTEGKVLLVMDRAPMSEDGKKCKFEESAWTTNMGLQMKLPNLMFTKARAILLVTDPKSGFNSFEESDPGSVDYLKSSTALKDQKSQSYEFPGMPKVILVHRAVADELLKGTGHTLEDLQKRIDSDLKPQSFMIKDKKVIIKETSLYEEKKLNNVAGFVEGRDPVLKNEIVVFSGHMDHIGKSEGWKINPGADDDASGCAAILDIAKAFQSLKKKPLRSVLFLWVSGEEIGLFGSQSYVNNPLFPLEKTVADLNMDMIGRVKGIADTTLETPMSGPNSVFVITDNQSKELLKIADKTDKASILDFDYSLSGRDHPLMLFARSDHYNFVRHDIPVLFFTTGLHTDYHTPGDIIDKLDFKKMELITRAVFEIGFRIADKKNRLVVDNPFSKWNDVSDKPEK